MLTLCVSGNAFADSDTNELDDDERDIQPIATDIVLDSDGLAQLNNVSVAGNPMAALTERWPEDLVIAPIPGYSPELGWMLTMVGGYFIDSDKEDDDAKPSVIGVFGMYSENDSYAYGAGTYLHLFQDRVRVRAAVGYLDINYRFYGVGNEAGDLGLSVDIQQEIPVYYLSATARIWRQLYAGLGFLQGSVKTRLRLGLPLPPEFPALGRTLDIAAWEIPLQFDTRDHEQFPRDGWEVDLRTFLYRKDIGSNFDAETYQLTANRFLPMRERDVLALRGYLRATGGNAPFFLLSTFGGRTDLRGYDVGRFRDRWMYAVQAEYRWHWRDRWIVTGFAGVGEVAPTFSDFGKNFLPAAGAGLRFVISEKHRVSLAADIGVGENGAQFYFGVGEAF